MRQTDLYRQYLMLVCFVAYSEFPVWPDKAFCLASISLSNKVDSLAFIVAASWLTLSLEKCCL